MNYLNFPIFDAIPLISNASASININSALVGKDYKVQAKIVNQPSYREFQYTYRVPTLEAARSLRDFFTSVWGRLGSFWLPSFKSDYDFVRYDTNVNQFTARATGRAYGLFNTRKHLLIADKNFAAKITFVRDNNDGTETVSLSAPLPSGITTGGRAWDEILRTFDPLFAPFLSAVNFSDTVIMNLYMVRLNQDEFWLEKIDANRFETTFSFIELQGETP